MFIHHVIEHLCIYISLKYQDYYIKTSKLSPSLAVLRSRLVCQGQEYPSKEAFPALFPRHPLPETESRGEGSQRDRGQGAR